MAGMGIKSGTRLGTVWKTSLYIIFLLSIINMGCSGRTSGEKSAIDTTVDYVTGKTPIEQGKRSSKAIKTISKNREDDIKKLGF